MDYIKAGGKDRPFRISYKAMKEVTSITEKEPDILTSNGGLDITELQFFLGFKHGAIKEGQKVDFEQSDIENWLDDDFGLIDKLTALVNKALPSNKEGKKQGN